MSAASERLVDVRVDHRIDRKAYRVTVECRDSRTVFVVAYRRVVPPPTDAMARDPSLLRLHLGQCEPCRRVAAEDEGAAP